jgi:integrase/recombinase XerD
MNNYYQQHIDSFNDYLLIERQFSLNTSKSYISIIEKMFVFFTQNEINVIENITESNIKRFLYDMTSYKTNGSKKVLASAVKSFFKYLLYDELLSQNPAEFLHSPKQQQKLPNFLSVKEIQKLLHFLNTKHVISTQRNKAIITTLYVCGLRVSELINLQINQIYFENSLIHVIGKGNKERIIPIDVEALKIIQGYIAESPKTTNLGHVFATSTGKQIRREHIWQLVKSLCKLTGLPSKTSPHTLRHSIATHLKDNGMTLIDLKEFLGHSSLAVTQVYTHTSTQNLRRAVNLL